MGLGSQLLLTNYYQTTGGSFGTSVADVHLLADIFSLEPCAYG